MLHWGNIEGLGLTWMKCGYSMVRVTPDAGLLQANHRWRPACSDTCTALCPGVLAPGAGLMLKRLDGSAAYEPSRRSEAWIKVGPGRQAGWEGRGARITRQRGRILTCRARAVEPALATHSGSINPACDKP